MIIVSSKSSTSELFPISVGLELGGVFIGMLLSDPGVPVSLDAVIGWADVPRKANVDPDELIIP